LFHGKRHGIAKFVTHGEEVEMRKLVGCLGLIVAVSACGQKEEVEKTETVSSALTYTGNPAFDPFWCTDPQTTCGSPAMHCCPAGWAMSGIHLANNKLQCRNINDTALSCATFSMATKRFVDEGQGHTAWIPACPAGKYMRGFDWHQNTAVCCTYPTGNTALHWNIDNFWDSVTEEVDPFRFLGGGTCNAGNVHTCAEFNGVMEGLETTTNRLLCAW
jgi:hypothetical protein